jgi:hypothetical protein
MPIEVLNAIGKENLADVASLICANNKLTTLLNANWQLEIGSDK